MVFTTEVSLVVTPGISPFRPDDSAGAGGAGAQATLERLPLLQDGA